MEAAARRPPPPTSLIPHIPHVVSSPRELARPPLRSDENPDDAASPGQREQRYGLCARRAVDPALLIMHDGSRAAAGH